MEDFDTRILVDAKEEYSKELVRVLKRYILEGIDSLYNQACEICKRNRSKTIITFQDLLEQIPKWNQELIEKETNRIIDSSKCEFFEDLITAVFVSHTRILAAIRTTKKNKKINLTIPKAETFIHKCYIEAAREFWKSPCMFDKKVSNFEQQRNNKYCEEIISHSIQETIRKLLPLKYILRESLGDSYEEEQSSDGEDITKSISRSDESNLKKLVQNEIKNHYSIKDNISDDDNLSSLLSDNLKKENNSDEKENNSDEKENDSDEKETKEDITENQVKDIKIQSGGNNLFSSNNINAIESEIDSIDNNSKSININTTPSSSSENKETVSVYNNTETDFKVDKKEENENLLDSKSIMPISENINTISDTEINKEMSSNLNSNEINLDSIQIENIEDKIQNSSPPQEIEDLNELDIGSLVNNNSVVKLDGNYNMVDSNELYNNLNKDTTIKQDVINDLSLNSNVKPNLFDDAPISD